MTDALITRLNNTRRLVIRQTSAITKYANTKADPLAVGREQGVDAVLDGVIQRSGDRVRVTLRLMVGPLSISSLRDVRRKPNER
jgi:TolB-like protein